MGAGYHGPRRCATLSRYLVPLWPKMVLKVEAVSVGSIIHLPGLTGDRRPLMAKAPAGKNISASKDSGSKSAPAEVARKAKSSVKGNGSHEAQAELDLLAGIEENEAEEEEGPAAPAEEPVAAAAHSVPEAPSASVPAAPTLKELGLSGKGMWKIDLNGKRINLDEKAWREELARALGRAPAKT